MMQIAIIGAGAAGLAAAYDLTNAGHAVTIYEAASEVGGLAAGFKAPHWDWTLEKFYHHWFASDKSILGLIAELGWSDQVLFPRPVTVIYHQGHFHPFDSMFTNMPLFLLRHFLPWDVARFGLVGAYLRFSRNWQPLERYTADEWTRRWFGKRIYEAIWRPMLVGKFGEEHVKTVNMAWLWARLHSRTTRLGTFKGGFQAFLNRMAERVRAQGAQIRLNTPVTGIRRAGSTVATEVARGTQEATEVATTTAHGASSDANPSAQAASTGSGYDSVHQLAFSGLDVQTAAGSERYDAVLSTSSPALMARLAPELPDAYSAQLRALKSMGAVVLIVTLDRPLTRYYWHNLPKEAGFPFLSLVEHTNYMSPQHYGGDHIIYCGDYLDPGHEYFQLSKEQLLERFLPAFTRFNPRFERSWVRDAWLWKTPYAQPVPPVNHSRNIPGIRTPLPGLYFASMSQVYPWDRGTNYAVEIGRRAARMMVAGR